MRMIWKLLKLVWSVLVLLVEAVFWLVKITASLVGISWDGVKGIAKLLRGTLRCPRGHEIQTEGQTYECTACSYTYTGSIFRCANPECSATTPYVNCPTCGLSVRSPYRWGR